MKSNREELIKQFVAASDISSVDLNSKSFLEEFSNWLKAMKRTGEKYVSFLSRLELFQDSYRCAEVNKGLDDSVTLSYNTKFLTPYIDENTFGYSNRIINANFSVNQKYTIPIISTNNIKMKVVPREKIRTYMTQNPYDSQMIEGWDVLHNSRRNNIVVGVYGNKYDKDMSEKKDALLRLRKKLDNNFKEIEYVLNDEYFYVVGTKQKKR